MLNGNVDTEHAVNPVQLHDLDEASIISIFNLQLTMGRIGNSGEIIPAGSTVIVGGKIRILLTTIDIDSSE